MVILSFYIKLSYRVLAQPLPKRFPASDRVYPKIPLRRRGKRHHHGGDVCGIVVFGSMSVLFLQQKTYGAGVFPSRPNPYSLRISVKEEEASVERLEKFWEYFER